MAYEKRDPVEAAITEKYQKVIQVSNIELRKVKQNGSSGILYTMMPCVKFQVWILIPTISGSRILYFKDCCIIELYKMGQKAR